MVDGSAHVCGSVLGHHTEDVKAAILVDEVVWVCVRYTHTTFCPDDLWPRVTFDLARQLDGAALIGGELSLTLSDAGWHCENRHGK